MRADSLVPGRTYHLPLTCRGGRITRWSAPVQVERVGNGVTPHDPQTIVYVTGRRFAMLPAAAPCAEAIP